MITTSHTTLRMSGAMNIEHLTALKLYIGVNAHGWAIVEGEVGENALEQLNGALAGREQHILTLDESGAEKCLFAGVIREAELVRVGGYNRFHVELLSGTCLMDREVRSRSFQDVGRTYSQVAQQVCSEYSGGAAICTVGEDKTLGQPVIQYWETDWEFLMRMASHCGGVLVPETHRGFPRLWFGFPDRSFTCEFPEDVYTSGISQRYYELGGSAAGYSKADFFYYDVESPQLCDLGWYTVFKGQPFIIAEKSAQLERGELIFTYRLGRPGLGWGKMLYNEKISGMTLLGEVLETSRETLKLKLDIDSGWNPGGPYPYTWRPETGNFMYCMPQVGTRVSLYCSNYDEKAAIAVNCVRTNGGDCDRMSDPTKRSFVTEHGKELNLYPGEMSIVGGRKGLIHLSDKDGCTIWSIPPIIIIALQNVVFEAPYISVAVSEKGELKLAKVNLRSGSVNSGYLMSNTYYFSAKIDTSVAGSNCVPYRPYDSELPQKCFNWSGLALATIGIVVSAAIVSLIGFAGLGAFAVGGIAVGAALAGISVGKVKNNRRLLVNANHQATIGVQALTGGQVAKAQLNFGKSMDFAVKSNMLSESDLAANSVAADKIVQNKDLIIKHASNYGVDPQIVAGVIFVEQYTNYDWIDVATDWFAFYGFDMSVGLGQVRLTTAKFLEDEGYVVPTSNKEGGWNIPFLGFIYGTTTMAREKRLENDEWSIIYASAYLRYFIDTWKDEYPKIATDPEILGALYNLGHEQTSPHGNPKPNDFGVAVGEHYNLMAQLLDLDGNEE